MPSLPKASRLTAKLRRLIDVANALPSDARLLRGINALLLRSEIRRELEGSATRLTIDQRKRRSEALEHWKKQIMGLPEAVGEYLGPTTRENLITISERWE